jgi:hypothetical protein
VQRVLTEVFRRGHTVNRESHQAMTAVGSFSQEVGTVARGRWDSDTMTVDVPVGAGASGPLAGCLSEVRLWLVPGITR